MYSAQVGSDGKESTKILAILSVFGLIVIVAIIMMTIDRCISKKPNNENLVSTPQKSLQNTSCSPTPGDFD
jgi:hypothetical protein